MLSTNITGIGNAVAPAVAGMIQEIVATFVAVIIPVLVAFWRRSASKSKIQTAIIDALVRGIEKSSDQIGQGETAFIKQTVKAEAIQAGVADHVDKAVKQVTTKMAEEKLNNS